MFTVYAQALVEPILIYLLTINIFNRDYYLKIPIRAFGLYIKGGYQDKFMKF